MTPDESAWTQFVAVTLAHAADNNPVVDAARVAAECADAMLAELRKRREAGVFGAGPTTSERADEARWLQEVMKRKQAERERDEARAQAAEVERLRAYVAKDCAEWKIAARGWMEKHDRQLDRAETAEKQFRTEADHRRCVEGEKAGVESLLKEALGVLERASFQPDLTSRCVLGADIRDVLAKAKAAGYGVEPPSGARGEIQMGAGVGYVRDRGEP